MADAALARRYARALVDLGQEADAVARFRGDLSSFREVLELSDGILRQALENPGIPMGERRGVLDAVLDRLSLHDYVNNFLRLLMDKGRFAHLSGIERAYGEMADELAGRVRATVTSARPLDANTADQVRAALSQATGKEVVIDFQQDPDLIGGLVAKVGDRVYDASVRARLDAMQQTLAQGGQLSSSSAGTSASQVAAEA